VIAFLGGMDDRHDEIARITSDEYDQVPARR
jgi:hypothetical protein